MLTEGLRAPKSEFSLGCGRGYAPSWVTEFVGGGGGGGAVEARRVPKARRSHTKRQKVCEADAITAAVLWTVQASRATVEKRARRACPVILGRPRDFLRHKASEGRQVQCFWSAVHQDSPAQRSDCGQRLALPASHTRGGQCMCGWRWPHAAAAVRWRGSKF